MVRYHELPEDFLHFVWSQGLFSTNNIKTDLGEALFIKSSGLHNHDAGPDFENARIEINGIEWVGSVEIHIKSSDWYAHHHENDSRYENVILHVVLDNDQDVVRQDGSIIPCLELKGLIRNHVIEKYDLLNSKISEVPCQDQFQNVDRMKKLITLDRMIVERLEEKSQLILKELNKCEGDWRELTYRLLSKTMGYKVNSEPMKELSERVSYKQLRKHKNNIVQIEALLLGASGLIHSKFKDQYIKQLKTEFDFLKRKYDFQEMNSISWKFSRMRPANFPTLRIAQFASLINTLDDLFSTFIESKSIIELDEILQIKQSEYWQSHVLPDQKTQELFKGMGKDIRSRILINTIIPLTFAYGVFYKKQDYKDKAVDWLESLPSENNKIIRKWKSIGLSTKTAFDSQSSIHLMTRYCHKKKCLQCPIGMDILSKESALI